MEREGSNLLSYEEIDIVITLLNYILECELDICESCEATSGYVSISIPNGHLILILLGLCHVTLPLEF